MFSKFFGVRKLVCIVISVFLLAVMCGTMAFADEGTVHIEVSDIYTEGNDQFAELQISNQAGARISFGWVNSCEILVTTDAGEFSFDPPWNEINQKTSTIVLKFPNCQGTIQAIEITDLRLLSNNGLPSKRLSNVVIFDAANNISSFTGSFPAGSQYADLMNEASDLLDSMLGKNNADSDKSVFESVASSASTIMTFGVVMIVIIAAGAIIAAICISKSNKKSVQTFQPFSAGDMHDQAHQTAMEMHRTAVDMHNQAHQTAMDAHNGFTPPPTPPMGF